MAKVPSGKGQRGEKRRRTVGVAGEGFFSRGDEGIKARGKDRKWKRRGILVLDTPAAFRAVSRSPGIGSTSKSLGHL